LLPENIFDKIGTISLYLCRHLIDGEIRFEGGESNMPIHIPYDSNLRYLPLMYFLPEDTIAKYPTLRALPRKVRAVMYSGEMMALVNDDAFLKEIADAVSALAFPHFGFGGWKEQYTGYCPVWQLTYALPLWARLLEKEIGWNLQTLMNIQSQQQISFFQPEYIKQIMGQVVKRAIEEEGWRPVLDAVREMPCDEDFEKWDTNVRKSFLRKWYHTRSKQVQMVSLEASIEDDEHHIHEIADNSSGFEDTIIADDYCHRFKERLSSKDMEILELRVQGFTYEAIAEKMGYKTHSAVIKRMKAITKAFIQYENEQQ
jgi:hypothetical protein